LVLVVIPLPSPSEIIDHIQLLPASQPLDKLVAADDAVRCHTPPYVLRAHLFTLLRHRVKTDAEQRDADTRAFVKQMQGGFSTFFDKLR
jgi:hypothetical protein